MMALTHAAIAAAGVGFILSSTDPLVMGLALLGSQLPDLDTTTSSIGQICFPISSLIEDRWPHRSVTHSLLASGLLFGVAAATIFLGKIDLRIAIALPLGHLIACFSDTFTKQGVQLFWPMPVWCVCGSNPRRRLRTGSTTEYWVLAVAIALLVFNLQLTSGGGLVQTASQQLGLKDGIIRIYNQNAATHQVWAEIKGVRASDRADASGKYLILGTEGSEFVVMDAQGRIYQTGQQLVVLKLTTDVGEPASTQIQTLTFDDIEAIAPLEQLRSGNPNADIFLSGSITVDFPEEVVVEVQPDQLQTLTVTGTTVSLNYCPIEKAIAALRDQWAMGTLSVKILSPVN